MLSIQKIFGRDEKFYDLLEKSAEEPVAVLLLPVRFDPAKAPMAVFPSPV